MRLSLLQERLTVRARPQEPTAAKSPWSRRAKVHYSVRACRNCEHDTGDFTKGEGPAIIDEHLPEDVLGRLIVSAQDAMLVADARGHLCS